MPDTKKLTIESQSLPIEAVIEKIKSGEFLVIAADQNILSKLPSGNWIGGSIPYFMTDDGGIVSQEHIFVNTISGCPSVQPPKLSVYDPDSIAKVAVDAPKHGFTILIMPGESAVELTYAQNSPAYPNMFFTPIIGWVSGYDMSHPDSAKVCFGPMGSMLLDQQAVAMHIALPETQIASINTINLFTEGSGPKIEFPTTGFNASTCLINGQEANLSEYIENNNVVTRLPLVADYSGIKINVSIKKVLAKNTSVDFYAPVFKDISYQFANPISDYITEFNTRLNEIENTHSIALSCNCLLNFFYSELEGKRTGDLTGPVVFGEIAYQLMNQTLVYLSITDI